MKASRYAFSLSVAWDPSQRTANRSNLSDMTLEYSLSLGSIRYRKVALFATHSQQYGPFDIDQA
jgi:hypothetical protein